jgi:hypothetical protein
VTTAQGFVFVEIKFEMKGQTIATKAHGKFYPQLSTGLAGSSLTIVKYRFERLAFGETIISSERTGDGEIRMLNLLRNQ